MKSAGVKAGAVLFGLLLLLGSGVVASADYVAYNLPTGTMGNQVWTGSLGMDFTTTQSIIITSIGSFDNDGVGTFTGGSITAAIYYASGPLAGTQVAGSQVAFNTGTTYTLVGASVFQAITPITLSAGATYSIVAWGYNGTDEDWNSGDPTSASLITNNGTRNHSRGATGFPKRSLISMLSCAGAKIRWMRFSSLERLIL